MRRISTRVLVLLLVLLRAVTDFQSAQAPTTPHSVNGTSLGLDKSEFTCITTSMTQASSLCSSVGGRWKGSDKVQRRGVRLISIFTSIRRIQIRASVTIQHTDNRISVLWRELTWPTRRHQRLQSHTSTTLTTRTSRHQTHVVAILERPYPMHLHISTRLMGSITIAGRTGNIVTIITSMICTTRQLTKQGISSR
jgi:hypothetical protein